MGFWPDWEAGREPQNCVQGGSAARICLRERTDLWKQRRGDQSPSGQFLAQALTLALNFPAQFRHMTGTKTVDSTHLTQGLPLHYVHFVKYDVTVSFDDA